ncbi:MAG: SBBP repeat-containing protein [Candidatus Syntrophosphaera sp.]
MKGLRSILVITIMLCGASFIQAQNPEWLWAVQAGGTGYNEGQSIAVDSQGNQYVSGKFQGIASFGAHTIYSSGNYDIFAAKLDPDGNWLWAVKAGGTASDAGTGIAVDASGNAYLTGFFYGTAGFGGYTLTSSGNYDIFAAKLDPNGNWLWAVKAGGTSNDNGEGIAVDGSGNAFLTGEFQNTATFGAHTIASSGDQDIFAAKLDPNGNWLWAVKAGGTSNDFGYGIAMDGSGNAFLTGGFQVTASFGGYNLTSSGVQDIFAAKLDTNGNWLWAVQAGGASNDNGYGIAMDGSGNAWLTGAYYGTASFGPYTFTSSGGFDIFAARLDTNGNWLWAASAGGISNDNGYGIAVDGSGNAWLTGVYYGTANFGSHTITSSGSYDIFAAKLDPNGNWLWAIKAGGASNDYGYGIAVDGADNAYFTGYFYGTAGFGPFTLTASGNFDIFAAKLEQPTLTALFNADATQGMEPLTVNFTDNSLPGNGDIIDWMWSFGDGNSSTEQNPTHTYTEAGVYTVSLTVTDEYDQTSTLVEPDYITVIEQVHAVELLSEEQLAFGDVWLEEQSPWQPVILSNAGNVDLNLSDAHFMADPLHFELSEPFTGLMIPPGEADSLLVRFAPEAIGALSEQQNRFKHL